MLSAADLLCTLWIGLQQKPEAGDPKEQKTRPGKSMDGPQTWQPALIGIITKQKSIFSMKPFCTNSCCSVTFLLSQSASTDQGPSLLAGTIAAPVLPPVAVCGRQSEWCSHTYTWYCCARTWCRYLRQGRPKSRRLTLISRYVCARCWQRLNTECQSYEPDHVKLVRPQNKIMWSFQDRAEILGFPEVSEARDQEQSLTLNFVCVHNVDHTPAVSCAHQTPWLLGSSHWRLPQGCCHCSSSNTGCLHTQLTLSASLAYQWQSHCQGSLAWDWQSHCQVLNLNCHRHVVRLFSLAATVTLSGSSAKQRPSQLLRRIARTCANAVWLVAIVKRQSTDVFYH